MGMEMPMGVGKGIGMMGWHGGKDGMGLGMVRRLGWYGDGVVTERTWHGLGDGMEMAKGQTGMMCTRGGQRHRDDRALLSTRIGMTGLAQGTWAWHKEVNDWHGEEDGRSLGMVLAWEWHRDKDDEGAWGWHGDEPGTDTVWAKAQGCHSSSDGRGLVWDIKDVMQKDVNANSMGMGWAQAQGWQSNRGS